ncbi:SprT family zinc-dependent metalloprotease [Helicobacter sp. 11S03491-1]|uniref:M48 family metallopeptidase n=1 Tax=Helicobacter sp. 11S03491-1 TaxID=1476196 RepID=UPI000BA55223|nr:SprT family zinc-dependent metalloprotease [Helicobacter sp. 11S03491-1]PAF42268.1 hypothetical protein BKH45_04815 [Helicobacter sp. 11S03491-1]
MEFLNTKDCVRIKKTNSKNIRIVIKQKGEIILNVPHYYSQAQSMQLLQTHHQWIRKNLDKIALNNFQIQQFLASHSDEILFFGEWKKLEKYINLNYLKNHLNDYIQTKTAIFSEKMGLSYGKISIRCNKTRLGSCSYQNNLSFSILLIFAQKDLIDYVIIHELSHIQHKNHSKAFWNFVEKFCPDYYLKRKNLHNQIKFYIPLLQKILSPSSDG